MTELISGKKANTSPSLLLVSQFIFNTGFYAVVPFLAIFLRDDMLLSGAAIGLVLGLRTFSQQGMFLVGGALTDRFGGRAIILCGCVVRISGYLLLAISASLWGVILGACLTGIGGALFSPAIESLMAQAGTQSEREGKRSRSEWFALFSVCGELGSVIGPLLGALLTGYSFQSVALGGAGVFLFALIMLYFMLPTGTSHHGTLKISPWWTAFHQRRFVAFIVAYSAYLFSYNQLYLALPVELRRSGGSEAELGPLFMLASVMIIFLQLPLARFARKRGASQILPVGFLLLALSFFSVALFAGTTAPDTLWRLLPAVSLVTLLTLGQMLIVPVGMDMIPVFARDKNLGAHYGALSSMGGATVLAGNFALGGLLDRALIPSSQAFVPWLLMGCIPLCSAVAMLFILRSFKTTSGNQ
ncbi:MFS transporter [Klebsiella pneumoniae]|jgi:MFS family permease|uniref:MFS transporter n=19 Tax=Gammaproteobacteria TaxID=1236 RepID=A0A367T6X8_KLEPN|nr:MULTISPECIES: MFS transporter [Enterobacteriaceae]EKU4515123.1 MFS transporter [Klebsiella aerogenes]EKV7916714.1 MFS transporter [Citrobacter koseri]MDU3756869.1 MFS transporter [Veillonella sp.]HBQ6199989.1 MFS transporter [Klebsiella variicola subsp. variicola]AAR07777.1 putative permease protein [Klebsiella pneumoniae CG43]